MTDVGQIRARLKGFRDRNLPVELLLCADADGDQETCEGYVVKVGDDFVLLARLFQQSWLNGFRAVRLSFVDDARHCDDEEFIRRAMTAREESLPPLAPIKADSIVDLVKEVRSHYPIVIVGSHEPTVGYSDVAGLIEDVEDGVIQLRLVSRQGYWIPGVERLQVQFVTELLFGSEYETTLHLVGELPDAMTGRSE